MMRYRNHLLHALVALGVLLAGHASAQQDGQTSGALSGTVIQTETIINITSEGQVMGSGADGDNLPVYLDPLSTQGLVQTVTIESSAPLDAGFELDDDVPWYIREGLIKRGRAANLVSRYAAPGMGSPPGWDANEYSTLRSTAGPRPRGELGLSMTEREMLGMDPVAGAIRRDAAGTPYFGTGPEADPALNVPLGADGLLLSSADFMDYDQERSIMYGHGHMVARVGAYRFSADRMLYNTRLRRLEAYGNVRVAGAGQTIEAQSLVLDTLTFEGVAFKARGQADGIYFLANPWKTDGLAEIRLLSRQESSLRNASFTTCDFPVPHWRLQAKDILVRPGDRVFARNAVLYIHDVPVMWLPFATQNLGEPFPWFASVGRTERTGYYVRTGYRFQHSVSTTDADGTEKRISEVRTALLADYFQERGLGYGVEGRYSFDQAGAKGRLFAYSLSDSDESRDELGSDQRQVLRWRHSQSLSKHLRLLMDLDWVSDPEVYYDVLDQLGGSNTSRERMFERYFLGGLEYAKDDLYAGLKIRFADRITRDRSSNPSDPRDNDQDFDRQFNDERFYNLDSPGRGPDGFFRSQAGRYTDQRSIPNSLKPGVRSSRFQRVVERAPVLNISTGRKQIGNWPLYVETKFDAFRALDAGFNEFADSDDATVTGWNFRQSLTHQLRLGSRVSWINRLGYGVGTAERDADGNTPVPGGVGNFPYLLNGADDRPFRFADRDTFLIGTRRRSFDSVRPEFAHVNYESILNARVTDALSAYLKLRLEEVTKDSLGEFYRSIGDIRSRDAIYPFPISERLVEAGGTYSFLSPRLSLNARLGQNLEQANRLSPNEVARYFNMSGTWQDARGVWSLSPGVNFQQRQFLDPSDPGSFLEDGRSVFATASYSPVHGRNYANISAYRVRNESGTGDGRDDGLGLSRSSSTSVVSARVGQKIGTKYLAEYEGLVRSESDTPSENIFRLSRDFHDLIATVALGVREQELSRDSEGTKDSDNFNLRFDVEFKPAGARGVQRVTRESSLFSDRKAEESR